MTATQDRQEGLEAVSDEIPWRDRSAFGSLRGVPWWGAVLIALCVSIAGAVADLIASGSLSTAFEGAFVIGCVAAVALARRRSLFGPIVQPPLILLVTVPAVVLLTKPPSGGLTAKALAVGTPLINSFPTMAIATGLTVVIGVVRLLVQRKPAGASDEEPAPRARRKKPAAPAKRRAPAASGKANAKAKASGKTRAAAADRSGKDRAAKDQAGKDRAEREASPRERTRVSQPSRRTAHPQAGHVSQAASGVGHSARSCREASWRAARRVGAPSGRVAWWSSGGRWCRPPGAGPGPVPRPRCPRR